MEFNKICKNRFSTRDFSSEKTSRETINAILEDIRLAPTALNMQPYEIVVANTDESLEKLNKSRSNLYGANTVLILCSDRSKGWHTRYDGEQKILLDMGIIVATALYSAQANGVDSCCVCNFDSEIVKKEFRLKDQLYPDALILLGKRSASATPSERHFSRRDVKEFVLEK